MAIDNTQVEFSSQWVIDQLVEHDEVTITAAEIAAGDANLPKIHHGLGRRPYVLIMYRPDTQSLWYEPGVNLNFSTSNQATLALWIDEQDITLRIGDPVSEDVHVRYWIYSDGK